MHKALRVLIILAVFFCFGPQSGQADIVYIKNGDKLFGTVQSPSFSVQTSYGKITIKSEFLGSIAFENRSVGRWVVRTINNDQFSGSWIDSGIELILYNGETKVLTKENIRRIRREIQGPSYPVTTTIFTMKNNDRFSGRFLNPSIRIRANFLTRTVKSNNINRIEFINDYQADTRILLNNGDLIAGKLEPNQIRMAPDTFSEFSISQSGLKTIQFNAPKMVLKNFSEEGNQSNKDNDGDGIPDYADICMYTPPGVRVGQDGCAESSTIAAGTNNHHKITGHTQINRTETQKTRPGEIKNILFDFDRFEIKPQFHSALDDVAVVLSRNPKARVEIQGHTDNIGSAEYNRILSEKRARTVKNYFVRKGVEKERLLPVGYGFTVNKASNQDESGRAQNRRVEFTFQN
jgi:outer membrane protein OmpA-like peptidoglycan-associated protein